VTRLSVRSSLANSRMSRSLEEFNVKPAGDFDTAISLRTQKDGLVYSVFEG
jgi:hypothetical protein